ncbi:hypothetical protein MJ699_01790 [Klebsiella pneumoniae]|nr:hypothetical protein MJ699_01790 [Klebsiella pneumoniae]
MIKPYPAQAGEKVSRGNNERRTDYSPGAKPLYAQLHDSFAGKTESWRIQKERCVRPTEAEFEEILASAVVTARRVPAELAAKGLVNDRPGIGTMVISTSEK